MKLPLICLCHLSQVVGGGASCWPLHLVFLMMSVDKAAVGQLGSDGGVWGVI